VSSEIAANNSQYVPVNIFSIDRITGRRDLYPSKATRHFLVGRQVSAHIMRRIGKVMFH